MQVRFELAKVDTVAAHRQRAEPTLLNQIIEETRDGLFERQFKATTTARLISGQDNREHLLHRTPNLLGHRPGRSSPLVMKSNPVINKRAHVRGQLPNSASPTGTSKLAKRENERDPPPDTPVRIVIPGKPNNVLFDFRTHP